MLASAKLDATGHRWIAALSTCNFNIKYRSGKKNANAVSLSRLPGSSQQQDAYQTVDIETVGAIGKSTEHVPFAETLYMAQEFQKFRIRCGLMYRAVKEDNEELCSCCSSKMLTYNGFGKSP